MLQIRWHGHACFEITNELTVVTDPHDGKSIGIPTPNVVADVILVSHDHYDHNKVKTVDKEESKVIMDTRKHSFANLQVEGISSYHDESNGEKRGENIIYKIIIDEIAFCHLGDLGHELDESTVEQIGDVDILFIPIGGTFTIDAEKAWKTIHLINPKIIVPMHYRDGSATSR